MENNKKVCINNQKSCSALVENHYCSFSGKCVSQIQEGKKNSLEREIKDILDTAVKENKHCGTCCKNGVDLFVTRECLMCTDYGYYEPNCNAEGLLMDKILGLLLENFKIEKK